MSYPHFFVSKKHKDGVSQVQLQLDLYELLKNIGDNIKKDGVFVPEVLRPLVEYVILETVVGPSHLAFLLDDGRVCRVAFSLLEDKLISLSERKKGRNSDSGRDVSVNRDGSSGSARSSGNTVALRNLRGSMSVMGRPRGSINILRDLQRGGGMYFRPPIAASDIPEEVIEQCQMVLQGKSRQVIVRELQRTNLDVNAAVNNLLSREDESDFNSASGTLGLEDDWGDDTEDIFSLLQQSEGLLMETEGDLPDEILDRTASPRFRREILMDCDRTLGDHATYTDRRKRRRFEANLLRNSENYRSGESGRSIFPYLGLSEDKEEENNQDGSNFKGTDSYIQLGDRLEFWTTISAQSPPSRFTSIAALYTELVAINSCGELHQWKWQSAEPFNPHNINSQPFNLDQPEAGQAVNHRHPRAASLGISHEKVISLSGCITRASIMTASGAIATWVDEVLYVLFHSIVPASSAVLNAASLALSRLEHPATHFSELKNEQVVHLSVAPLISVVQCVSGAVYWWGVLPSYIRQKNADKQKNSTGATITTSEATSTRHQNISEGSDVVAKVTNTPSLNPGDLVCMRNAPMFHAGAVGFTLISGIPKVGVLLEDSWKLTDVCRFRVKSPSLKSFSAEKLLAPVNGKNINSASTEAVHALTCPHAQEIAAAFAAAAASQVEHESSQLDTGAVEMPPPPSPASSTCSDHSGPVKVSPGTFKRKKAPSTSGDSGNLPSTSRSDSLQQSASSTSQQSSTKQQLSTSKPSGQSKTSHDEEIEDWCLSDVHFVEDGRNQPVGVLMKLDGNIAAVKFLKEQDRACLAARCPASPVCQFINYISKSGTGGTLSKPFAMPGATSSQSASGCVPQDPFSWINDCRLLNKSDIIQVKQPSGGGLPQRVPDFVQPTPRHITMGFLSSKSPTTVHSNSSSNSTATNTNSIKKKIISLAPENSRIHAIVGRCSTDCLATSAMHHLEYHVFTLNGKTVSSRRLPALANKAGMILDVGNEKTASYSNITLTSPSERPLLLRDSAGVVFPFLPPSRPGQESWVFPPWIDLPPVQCAALAWINTSAMNPSSGSTQDRKRSGGEGDTRNNGSGNVAADKKSSAPARLQNDSRLLFGVIITRETNLLQHIIRTDEVKVEETLRSLAAAAPSRIETIASEMADGHQTILHMAVLMCAPLVRETSEMANTIENILKRSNIGGSTADGSGWTTIPPSSSTQQPSGSLPRSIQSILNLTPGSQRPAPASSTSSSIHDFFIRSSIEAAAVAASSGTAGTALETTAPSSSNSYFCHLSSLTSVEESSRRPAAHRIFRALMDNKRLRGLMPNLLASLSDDCLTPFMLAVQCKAYQVAAYILDFLIEMEGIRSDGSEEAKYQFRYARLMRYLYPSSTRLDDSPLFNLAYNDTCSFTWTGPKHIRQDIFECRTCGLMDSLCCCSECARVCHKGHDCRLKRTSPTAYCDCWEKCRCRSLISGHQDTRKDLFKRLLDYTDMVYLPNRLNDHLMVYLARRVVRQWKEQKQFKSIRRHGGGGGGGGGGGNGGGGGGGGGGGERNRGVAGGGSSNPDEPEHDLDPPVFSRQALEITLDSKAAAASLLCDCKQVFLSYPHGRYEDKKNKSADSPCVQAIQSGTAMLDEFVFLLVCKYPAEFVQRLVNTLALSLSDHLNGDCGVRQLMTLTFSTTPPDGSNDAFYYCQKGIARFVRSLSRIYTGLMLSLAPDHNKKKSRLSGSQGNTLELIRSIFSQLAPVALPELASLAAKIISPVRTGALLFSGPFELSPQLQDAIHTFEQLISSEKSGNSSRSRQAQSNTPFYQCSGHGPDCPNAVIRHLIYGFDGSNDTSSTILPTWINIKRQLAPISNASVRASEQKAEQPMEVEYRMSSTSRPKRRRQESINSDSPQTKHRRRHHHRKRHRHGDSNASTGGSGPSDPSAPPPSQPPVIVIEPMATTTTTSNTSNASNTFAEMELTAPGDSDTDGDVRSNELDSNATTTAVEHHHHMEEEYFSDTASEDETISRGQLEAPGSQHSSISSTAATAGTTGSVILDSLDNSRREQQNESAANTTLGEEEGESTMVVTTYCGSDEEEDEMMTEEVNANNQEMQGLASSIRRSISRRQERDERRRQQQRRFAGMHDDDDEEDNEDTEEEEDEESDMSADGEDEEISVESGGDSEDSDDSESDSESDDSDEEEGEDIEGEDESVSETEEEEEEDMEEGEDDEERGLSLMDDDDNEQDDDRDEDDEEAYSQESDSSPPPSPYAPWTRRRQAGAGNVAGGQTGQGSSSTNTTTQGGGNANAGGAEEGVNANASQSLTSTTATASVSRPMSSSGSVMARLYSAALSSAFDRRNVRGTSLNALTGWTPFGGPLSPSQGNGATDPSAAPAGNSTNNSSNAATSAAPTGNNNNSEAQASAECGDVKNGGIHVTEVQLSRAMGTLLRLIADVMGDLVNQDGDNGEEEGDDTDCRLHQSASAPVLLTPPVGMIIPRKWRTLTRNRGGMVQTPTGCILTPLRSLVVARPADSVGRALICAAMGSILAPIWDWISECLDDLEVRLRARVSWNERRPDVPATEFFNGDYGKSKPRKENATTGSHQNQQSSQNQSSTVGPNESAILIGTNEGDSGIVAIETTAEGGGSIKGSANRAQMLSYVISLMRSMHNEHDSYVPAVDISSYKHSAYLLDAFIYFFRAFESTWPSGLLYHLVQLRDSLPESMELGEEFDQLQPGLFQGHPLAQRTHSFFRRSMSTLSINAPPVDAILNPAAESLPLAVTPQALEPEAERNTYFAVDKNSKLYSDFSNLGGDAYSNMDEESRSQLCMQIGKTLKNIKLGQRIARGGEFLDSVCHSGSTMMRWSRSLNAFASAFSADISIEPRSYMVERLSFTAKEARFRKDMERLRLCTKYDLSLEIDRDPSALILNTATQLNNELSSRLTQSAVYGNSFLMRDSASVADLLRFHHENAAITVGAISPQASSALLNFPSSSSGIPVLLSRRVKVVFRGEPGEGSGVTRSFISSFAEAVTADTHLPDLSSLYPSATGRNVHQEVLNSARAATQTSLMAATSRLFNRLRLPLSSNSNSIAFASSAANNATTTTTTGSGSNNTQTTNTSSSSAPIGSAAGLSRSRRSEIQAARNLFRSPYTSSISINLATPSNTQSEELTDSVASPEPTAVNIPVATTETVETTTASAPTGESSVEGPERDPLFWQPGHSGFFSPRGIPKSLPPDCPAFRARMDLYRCVGRVVALSLLHSEICPISFNRHVLKYILGRPLCWHDFAFYNVDIFEGLRQILLPVARGDNADNFSDFGLNFSLVLAPEEGGNASNSAIQLHQLVPNGDDIDVDAEKVFEYVKRYAEFKMLYVAKDALEQIRLGVFDVLPANALDGLTPEDLRLLLNGITEIDVDMLSGYTTFIDESNCGASLAAEGGSQQSGGGGGDSGTDCGGTTPNTPNPAKDRIDRLKRWFWHVVRGMNPRQRQDLLYFWTSSPALPPSALGFEPTPTIVIRPADDQHLPTANTCISRLYLPLYSSRQILREKLLSAIETRSFGFV